MKVQPHSDKPYKLVAVVGSEPTPLKRLVPQTSWLPLFWHSQQPAQLPSFYRSIL